MPTAEIIQELRRIAPKCKFVLWPRLGSGHQPGRLVEAIHTIAQFPNPRRPVRNGRFCLQREGARDHYACRLRITNEEIASSIGAGGVRRAEADQNLSAKLGAEDRYELAMYGLSTLSNAYQQEERI